MAQAEIQRLDAKERERVAEEANRKREEAQKADALKRDEINLVREQLLVQLKMEADKNNSEREQMQAELNQKREQSFMEHELKRQKLIIDANSSIQLERVKQDSHKEIANLEALERRELEFQQLQE